MSMPRPRSAMRKIRGVLRLTFAEGLSRRQVARAVGEPYTTVANYVARAGRVGRTGPDGPAVTRLDRGPSGAAAAGRDPAAAPPGIQGAGARGLPVQPVLRAVPALAAAPGRGHAHWIACQLHAFEFFGGVPRILVPDYVARHIIRVLCPSQLCGWRAQ